MKIEVIVDADTLEFDHFVAVLEAEGDEKKICQTLANVISNYALIDGEKKSPEETRKAFGKLSLNKAKAVFREFYKEAMQSAVPNQNGGN